MQAARRRILASMTSGPRAASEAPPVGRFAPSPTGPLHFGSLVAAAGSYLCARAAGGRWLVRIDDLDGPRNVPGALDAILRDLERLALDWDDEIVLQSHRGPAYDHALERLRRAGHTFDCACSRREVGIGPYPGTCRDGVPAGRIGRSLRVRVGTRPIEFVDGVRGLVRADLAASVGDFVVRRADHIVAYHLATVVDDADAGVDQVVRGGDLLDSTGRQVHLQQSLGLPTPAYAHLPIAVNAAGQKLSKQTHAEPIGGRDPAALAAAALAFLGHAPPAAMRGAPPAELWAWATSRWDLSRITREPAVLPVPGRP